ncbi:hypothetical protein GF373_12590, partial [bacterium]|nr:hypothetical protein [bacterium]
MQNRFDTLSIRQKIALYFLFLAILLLLFVLGAEWILRGKGIQPWQPAKVGIEVEPGGQLFQPHPELGYIHLPGRFT